MKHRPAIDAGFSMVEMVVALGVAAFALLAVMGILPIGLKTQQASVNQTKANAVLAQIIDDLRADVRLPPGQASKAQCDWSNLHGHWVAVATPGTLYFAAEANYINNSLNATTVPAPALFRAPITYLFPQPATPSIAKLTSRWPRVQSELPQPA